MRKIKKCIGLLLAIALAGNLCAVNIPVSEVYAQEVEEQTNDVQSAGSTEKNTLSNDEGTEPQVVMEEPQEQNASDSSENSVSVEESAVENTAETEGIKLKGVSIKGNKDVSNLSAPDSFTVEVRADIPEGANALIVSLGYWSEATKKSATYNAYSDKFSVEADGTTKIEVDVNINQYSDVGDYDLTWVYFSTMSGGIYIFNNSNGQLATSNDGITSNNDGIAYNGEIDYSITSSPNADSSAPEITGVRFMTEGDIYTTSVKTVEVDYAWNMVGMDDGKYYWLDATWDDQPYKQFQHDYFLVGDQNFTDHIADSPEGTGANFLYALPEASDVDYVYDPNAGSEETLEKGDINGDSNINLVDLMLCLNHVGSKELLEGKALIAADINNDDTVNLVDLMRLLNYVGGKSDSL